ncbi:MAG: transporter substrate-binding domain-containing protein [Gammaproteobacteria bacterium]|nr:transporter substrate-binding domain-containing protein [Gammaproteobacteria bacterium]
MKTWLKQWVMIGACVGSLCSPLLSADTVRITNGEWPPYLSSALPHYGLASRIVTEAFAEHGIEVEYGFFPWNRSIELAKAGHWDGTAVWHASAEREALFYISEQVIYSEYVFFHLKDREFQWSDIEDLARYRLGGAQGYHYGEAFEKAEQAGLIKVERVRNEDLILNMLLVGRVDAVPINRLVGYYLMGLQHDEATRARIVHHSKPLLRGGMHLLLSRKNPANAQRMQKFNAGLRTLQERGIIDAYIKLMLPAELKTAPTAP